MPIGRVRGISFTVSVFVCLSARFLVSGISGAGSRRAMKFCRVVDPEVADLFPLLVNFGPKEGALLGDLQPIENH